jgi:putative transposase
VRRRPGLAIHLIVDNYATHKHAKVRAWLDKRPRFKVHFTPTGSSWLNQVERFFADLTGDVIRFGSFEARRGESVFSPVENRLGEEFTN